MMPWPSVALGDLCIQDRRIVGPDDPTAKDLPFIGLEQVQSGTGNIALAAGSRSGDGKSVAFRFDERYVLYGKLRPYLNKVALPDFKGRCSTELVPLIPSPRVDREYLAALLRRKVTIDRVMAANTGSRMPRADVKVLMSLTAPLPPLPEQRRIVDILNRANGIGRLRREAQEKARQVIPALFAGMFGEPANNAMGFPLATLGEVIIEGPQNGIYRPSSDYGSGVPILRIDSFYDGQVGDITALRRVRLNDRDIQKYGLKHGDIVINRVNSRPFLGKSAIIPALSEPTVFESNMMRFSVRSDIAIPQYVIAALQHPSVREQLLSKAKDAINQSSINQTDVRNVTILLPPLPLQQAFVSRVADLQSIVTQQERAAAASEQLVDSIMGRIFSTAA